MKSYLISKLSNDFTNGTFRRVYSYITLNPTQGIRVSDKWYPLFRINTGLSVLFNDPPLLLINVRRRWYNGSPRSFSCLLTGIDRTNYMYGQTIISSDSYDDSYDQMRKIRVRLNNENGTEIVYIDGYLGGVTGTNAYWVDLYPISLGTYSNFATGITNYNSPEPLSDNPGGTIIYALDTFQTKARISTDIIKFNSTNPYTVKMRNYSTCILMGYFANIGSVMLRITTNSNNLEIYDMMNNTPFTNAYYTFNYNTSTNDFTITTTANTTSRFSIFGSV